MWAILSDIHGNLEALTAVLADVERHGAERVLCLGDLVVYGPDACACVDLVMWTCAVVLRGNMDTFPFADLGGSACSETVRRQVEWTRGRLEADAGPAGEARRQFLRGLPLRHAEGGLLSVHGSPRNPLHEYVFPEDVYNEPKMEGIFASVERCCFHGHTHVPGVIVEPDPSAGAVDPRTGERVATGPPTAGPRWDFVGPEECDPTYHLPRGRRALVDVGSVGQPRDGDWRACYVLFDGETVRFRRVPYDVDRTVAKICARDGDDPFQGARLREGR